MLKFKSGIKLWTVSIYVLICALLISGCSSDEKETDIENKDKASDAEDTVERIFYEGDVVVLGAYEQDNNLENGKEPIEWIVLREDVGDNEASTIVYMVSRYILDYKPFDMDGGRSWESSSLKKWMNGDFLIDIFPELSEVDSQERSNAIGPVLVDTPFVSDEPFAFDFSHNAPFYDKDYMYRRRHTENGLEYLYGYTGLRCHPTPYAEENGCEVDTEGYAGYWILSGDIPVYLSADGNVENIDPTDVTITKGENDSSMSVLEDVDHIDRCETNKAAGIRPMIGMSREKLVEGVNYTERGLCVDLEKLPMTRNVDTENRVLCTYSVPVMSSDARSKAETLEDEKVYNAEQELARLKNEKKISLPFSATELQWDWIDELKSEILTNPVLGDMVAQGFADVDLGDGNKMSDINPWITEFIEKTEAAIKTTSENSYRGMEIWIDYDRSNSDILLVSDEYQKYAMGICALLDKMHLAGISIADGQVWQLPDNGIDLTSDFRAVPGDTETLTVMRIGYGEGDKTFFIMFTAADKSLMVAEE